jgi:hypothetical protein
VVKPNIVAEVYNVLMKKQDTESQVKVEDQDVEMPEAVPQNQVLADLNRPVDQNHPDPREEALEPLVNQVAAQVQADPRQADHLDLKGEALVQADQVRADHLDLKEEALDQVDKDQVINIKINL